MQSGGREEYEKVRTGLYSRSEEKVKTGVRNNRLTSLPSKEVKSAVKK